MERSTINDLPNELLELIFDHLEVDDLKDASLVCKRWSDLAFQGRRMDRVTIVQRYSWGKGLLQSKRKHRHIELRNTTRVLAYIQKLLQTFSITSLRITDFDLTLSSLRLILLEAPNLQHLSIGQEPKQMNEIFEPFPVMRNLKYLDIECGTSDSSLPWHTIAPSLQGLKMFCESEAQLEQWRHFSGQLKHVYATLSEDNLFTRFYEMTFPVLEELSMKSYSDGLLYEEYVQRHSLLSRHEFFRRHGSLRRLRLDRLDLSKTLVEDITHYSKKLASLEMTGRAISRYNDQPGSLESLSQLTELKHLRLNILNADIFRGCEKLTSLQSLSINSIKFNQQGSLGFLEYLFRIAPQLRCLQLGDVKLTASEVQYICHRFTKLTRLQLTYSEEVSRDGLSRIDRLPHLLYLELKLFAQNISFISTILPNKVRCFTLHLPYDYHEDELLRLPETFPQLDRLNLISFCNYLHESTVDKLRQLLPTCVIKIYGYFTNAETRRCFREWPPTEMMPVWEKEWVLKKPDRMGVII